MKRSLMFPAILTIALLGAQTAAGGAQTPASTHERHLKKADLPAAVQRTVEKESQGATIRGYSSERDGGALEYEVEMTLHGHSRDVDIAPDGSVLAVEEQVTLADLPSAVRSGLERQANGGKIVTVESITKRGTLVAYEARVRNGRKHSEVQVGPDGKPLAQRQ